MESPTKKTLVVLAAGLGTRYGGLKQLESFGPSGELILDYSVFDALRAGFGHVVFVMRHELEDDLRRLTSRVAQITEVDYAIQDLGDLPAGCTAPRGRNKPWGTAHAILSVANAVDGPFAVINADDFYGPESYRLLADFLDHTAPDPTYYALVGYRLRNTLSDRGGVSRAICAVNSEGMLSGITELTDIAKTPHGLQCGSCTMTGNEIVSMNCWGFKPGLFSLLRKGFVEFLSKRRDELNAEYFIPTAINELVEHGVVRCAVLPTSSKWVGVTYPSEKADVVSAIRDMIQAGMYPKQLWG
jgi:dTDP-glucose pyrophosphorylase